MIKHLYDFDGEFPLQIIVQPQQSNILKENSKLSINRWILTPPLAPPTEEPLEVASPVKKNEVCLLLINYYFSPPTSHAPNHHCYDHLQNLSIKLGKLHVLYMALLKVDHTY